MTEKEKLKELVADVEKSVAKIKEFLKNKEIKSVQKKKEVFHSDTGGR